MAGWHFEFKFVSESVSPGGGWFWIAIGSRKVDPKGWGVDLGSCREHVMPRCALGTSPNEIGARHVSWVGHAELA